MRQENKREDLYRCNKCNKWYCGKTGLSHHKKICDVSLIQAPDEPIPHREISIQEILQEQITEMKLVFEAERQEMNTKLISIKNEMQNIKIQLENKKEIAAASQPVNIKRRKINKHVRQTILDKQKNICGGCKDVLTPYFQIDHIIGLQFGGTDEESNLMALCCECHAMKSIAENQCRKQIQDSIQTILREKLNIQPVRTVVSTSVS